VEERWEIQQRSSHCEEPNGQTAGICSQDTPGCPAGLSRSSEATLLLETIRSTTWMLPDGRISLCNYEASDPARCKTSKKSIPWRKLKDRKAQVNVAPRIPDVREGKRLIELGKWILDREGKKRGRGVFHCFQRGRSYRKTRREVRAPARERRGCRASKRAVSGRIG